MKKTMSEPAKARNVYWTGDVVVAGSGLSGSFAAIAAAKHGAKTILIDRFGAMGGNMGPAMIVDGSLLGGCVWRGVQGFDSCGYAAISAEFRRRVEELNPNPAGKSNIPSQSFTASYVLAKMAKEAGVEFLTSSYTADPIMKGKTVKGLFVETCSGRVAVMADIVIDATGEAAIAARAGAPMIRHVAVDEWVAKLHPPMNNPEYAYWNDTHLLLVMAGVDCERYNRFAAQDAKLSAADKAWDRQWGWSKGFPKGLVHAARLAWERDGFRIHGDIGPKKNKIATYISGFGGNGIFGNGVATCRIAARGQIDCDDAKQISEIENFLRTQGYRWFSFLKKNAPGFENALVVGMSNYLGMRGGPCIDGEHLITVQEKLEGRKFPDVIYRNFHTAWYFQQAGAEQTGFDVPYRCLLSRGIDGLLVIGRGASFIRRGHEAGAMRDRGSMRVMGEAAGMAAAMAVKDGVTPRRLNVKKLQKKLIRQGFYLGPDDRLRELGLKYEAAFTTRHSSNRMCYTRRHSRLDRESRIRISQNALDSRLRGNDTAEK